MSSLQIRDLPENLYQALMEESKRQNRSLTQQAILILARGLSVDIARTEKRRALLKEVLEKPLRLKKNRKTETDPARLLREDRER